MQISEETIKILENLSAINESIIVEKSPNGENTPFKTINKEMTLFVEGVFQDVFEEDFCIYDLKSFLAVLNGFGKSAETIFQKDKLFVKSSEGSSSVRIVYADPAVIVSPGDKSINLPSIDFEYSFTEEVVGKVLSFSNILGLPHIRIFNDGGKLTVQATDKKNPDTNQYSAVVGDIDATLPVDIYYKKELIKNFVPGDYDVKTSLKGLSVFTHKSLPVNYTMAHEK